MAAQLAQLAAAPIQPSMGVNESTPSGVVTNIAAGKPKRLPREQWLQTLNPKDIRIVPYSDKSFKVEGEATRLYTDYLKDIGGIFRTTWNGGPGWVYSNSKLSDIQNLISNIQQDLIKPEIPATTTSKPGRNQVVQARTMTGNVPIMGFPVGGPVNGVRATYSVPGAVAGVPLIGLNAPALTNTSIQTVVYRLTKPITGMTATVKTPTSEGKYTVVATEDHPDSNGQVTDVAYIIPSNNPAARSKLVITNGQWQVSGYNVDHSIWFS